MSPGRALLTLYKIIVFGVGFMVGVQYTALMKALHNGDTKLAVGLGALIASVIWAGWYITSNMEGDSE